MQSRLFIGFILLLITTLPAGSFAASDCPLLDTPTATAQLETLSAEVLYHNRLYYQELRPVLSDAEYDRLYAKLVRLEACFPLLVSADSPTRRVGSAEIDPKLTIAHAQPMLSLTSSSGEEAVAALLQRVQKVAAGKVLYLVQPKFDGLPVELLYLQGKLVAAATRGDGLRGEDVTTQAQKIPAIPQKLRGDYPPRVLLHGEVYARKQRPESAPLSATAEPYATLRHQAVATLRNHDATPEALAALAFFPFTHFSASDTVLSDRESLRALKAWGFPDPLPQTWRATSLAEIRDLFATALAERSSWLFAADGIVVKVDDLALRRTLGDGSRAPNWAAAWKFPAATALTTVTEIVWQTGRTGRKTPVATLAPITLAGIQVEHVTLHNAAELERLDLIAGDEVQVALSGDVIPQIVAVTRRIPRPAVLAGVAVVAAQPDDCYRAAPHCSAQFLSRAVYFASPTGLNIAGLGRGRLQSLIASGLVTDLPSLLTLQEEKIVLVDGLGAATATKIATALQNAQHPQPWRLLAALGIESVGPKALARLQKHYATLGAVTIAAAPELASVIGDRPGAALSRFLASPAARPQLTAFYRLGLLGEDEVLKDWLDQQAGVVGASSSSR
jgi:DNA ligase (NAD+)